MCEPTTILAIASVASTAASVVAQGEAANAQASSNQRQYDNTMRAYRENINQTNLAQQQEREAALMKVEDNNMKARSAQSTATVAAGEAGIAGLSVDALLGDLAGKSQRYNTSVQTNFDRSESAIMNQRENVYSGAASQINGLQTPQAPDYLGAALKIGTTAYDYYNPRVSDARTRR